MFGRHINLLRAAADNVARRGGGYAVAASGLVVGLTLLLSGVAISEGVRAEALDSVAAGADVYCTWDAFGRDVPVARDWIAPLGEIPGVIRATPRIIGRLPLGDEQTVIIGVPLAALGDAALPVHGERPDDPAEVLVGAELARALGLVPGSRIALEGAVTRLFVVAGITDATASLWSAKAIVCDLDEAAIVFGMPDHVSDVCLDTRPGYATRVAESVRRLDERFRVQTRAIVRTYVTSGMTIRGGIFTVLFAVVLALAIPSFAIMTYLGHAPRRRDIGLLKAEGWRTADVLEMVAFENLIVSVGAAAIALALAWIWVRGLNAPGIASFFLTDLDRFPAMRIPARFVPLPPVLAIAFALVVTMTGSIYTTWRTAIARPAEVLR